MQVSRISIRNILGVEALEFTPTAVTRITGGNGAGKTSVVEALKAVCKGGHDVTLLRKGQDRGEIAIEFDSGLSIRKRITENGSYLDVRDGEGNKVAKPSEYLARLWDALAANPVAFMTGTTKQRIDWLLENLDPEPVRAKLGEQFAGWFARELHGLGALEAIANVEKAIRADRADANREAKRAAETVATLRSDLPPEGEDVAGEIAKLEQALENDAAEWKKRRARVIEETTESASDAGKDFDAQTAELTRKIEALQAEIAGLSEQRAAIARERSAMAEAIRTAHREAIADLERQEAEARQPIRERIAALREQEKAAAAAGERRRMIAKLEGDLGERRKESEALTALLEDLEAVKLDTLGRLPIKGVEIVDGSIVVDGIPFKRLNTAKQWAIAIRVAKQRAGDVGIVCADGLEALDDANFEAFRAMAAESGLHFIVTDRGNGALEVDTEGRRTAA